MNVEVTQNGCMRFLCIDVTVVGEAVTKTAIKLDGARRLMAMVEVDAPPVSCVIFTREEVVGVSENESK